MQPVVHIMQVNISFCGYSKNAMQCCGKLCEMACSAAIYGINGLMDCVYAIDIFLLYFLLKVLLCFSLYINEPVIPNTSYFPLVFFCVIFHFSAAKLLK